MSFEQEPPSSPDSTQTTFIMPTFSRTTKSTFKTDIEIARHHVTSSSRITFSLVNKLFRIQQRLSSDLGFENEDDGLMATRKWADDVLNVAWEITTKAGRLIDDVDYLLPRLGEEETEMSREQEKVDDKEEESRHSFDAQEDQDEML